MEPPSHEDARDQASPNGVLELLAPLEADSLEACVEIEAMLAGDDGLPADLGGSDAGGDIDDLDDGFDKLLGGD